MQIRRHARVEAGVLVVLQYLDTTHFFCVLADAAVARRPLLKQLCTCVHIETARLRGCGMHAQDLVIYEMPVRAFTSSETSGLPAPQRGSFKGVAEKVSAMGAYDRASTCVCPCMHACVCARVCAHARR